MQKFTSSRHIELCVRSSLQLDISFIFKSLKSEGGWDFHRVESRIQERDVGIQFEGFFTAVAATAATISLWRQRKESLEPLLCLPTAISSLSSPSLLMSLLLIPSVPAFHHRVSCVCCETAKVAAWGWEKRELRRLSKMSSRSINMRQQGRVLWEDEIFYTNNTE